MIRQRILFGSLAALLLAAGCTVSTQEEAQQSGGASTPGIRIDGSSTVAPLSSAISQQFVKSHSDLRSPVVNISGSSGGFQKFSNGEIDISDASRPIKQKEIDACAEAGIEPVELRVAIDGLSVVVNKDNDWCKSLTVAQLTALWSEGSTIKTWKDLNPEWPDNEIKLFGPDDKSGTYDYFREEIIGKDGNFRADYSPNSDDNVLVTGIAGDKYAIGYFGYSYMVENKDKISAVAISNTDNPEDGVLPSQETIEQGKYTPLARPLFIYVAKKSLQNRTDIRDFCEYYLSDEAQEVVKQMQFISLNAEQLQESREALSSALGE
ncbi:MAG: PstS family phosphate ABC transporter substrate-binding protein [Planctomycetaceae bacterium]|nr:PstS family phosphate ABC transporter substrate-binding protein [Planctomycetaceae bacterium]MCB9951278.1 PstS family phosphate ABC transporter substrate-binding protein [Planctomycetaceae bacterium]